MQREVDLGTAIRDAFLAGRHVECALAAQKLRINHESDPNVYRQAGISCRMVGRWAEATAHFQTVVMLDPQSGVDWAELGECWYDLRQLAQAEYAWIQADLLGSLYSHHARLRRIAKLAVLDALPESAQLSAQADSADHNLVFPNVRNIVGPDALPVVFTLGPALRRKVLLQVDDAPSPDITPVILDVLRDRGVKAGFFIIGLSAERHPEMLGRIVSEGHSVFSHGYSHEPFVSLSDEEILNELRQTEQLLSRYRPTPHPYRIRLPGGMGWDDPRIHKVLASFSPNAAISHWSVDTRDYRVGETFADRADLELAARLCVLEALIDDHFSGAIVISHDRFTTALPRNPSFVRRYYEVLCDSIRACGFEFASPEMKLDDYGHQVPAGKTSTNEPKAEPGFEPKKDIATRGWEAANQVEVFTIESSNIGSIIEKYDLNGLPLEAYLRTAKLPWINHDYPYAYAIMQNGRFYGWLQAIYADRQINGEWKTICNLSSWYVLEEFRSSSMRLMFKALSDAGSIPLTALTPSGLAAEVYKALRFRTLDFDRYALPIQTEIGPIAKGDGDEIFWSLSPESKRVYNDHRMFSIQHCLIETSDGHSFYFIYKTRDRIDIRVADLLYLEGDLNILFSDWRPAIGSELATSQRLLIDSRFLGEFTPAVDKINPFNARYYRGPAELGPAIDYMYSEIPIYLPSMQ